MSPLQRRWVNIKKRQPRSDGLLRKICQATFHRDTVFRVTGLIELGVAYVGSKPTVKGGRGTGGKGPILAAAETREKGVGFMASEAVDTISKETPRESLKPLLTPAPGGCSNTPPTLSSIQGADGHPKNVTSSKESFHCLSQAPMVIGNLETFLNRILPSLSHEYVPEPVDDSNHELDPQMWELRLPIALPNACFTNRPFNLAERCREAGD